MAGWSLRLYVRLSEASSSAKRRAAAQGLVEYALLVMFVALIIIAILTLVGQTLCTQWYEAIAQNLFAAPPNPNCQ